jgi:hypothetical protein
MDVEVCAEVMHGDLLGWLASERRANRDSLNPSQLELVVSDPALVHVLPRVLKVAVLLVFAHKPPLARRRPPRLLRARRHAACPVLLLANVAPTSYSQKPPSEVTF